MPRQIGILLYPDFQLLDAAGVTTTFEIAGEFGGAPYETTLLSQDGGLVRSSSGILASQVGMSPRNFSRSFRASVGMSPARAVERLRLEAARERVEGSTLPIEAIASMVGFHDPERMRRAFLREFQQPPQAMRRNANTTH